MKWLQLFGIVSVTAFAFFIVEFADGFIWFLQALIEVTAFALMFAGALGLCMWVTHYYPDFGNDTE